MSHEYNDADWEYEVDSVQRGGITAKTRARRHGERHTPKQSDDHDPKDEGEESDSHPAVEIPGV